MNEQIQFRCECGASLRAPLSAAGRAGTCRHCGKRVEIPVLAAAVHAEDYVAATSDERRRESSDSPASSVDSRWPPGAHVRNGRSDAACPALNVAPIAGRVTSEEPSPPPRRESKHTNNSSGVSSGTCAKSEITRQLCSICQTPIQTGDLSTICDECHLPFHVECWEENLGCSTYGCPNVNALRAGPDIQINSPPPLPSRFPATARDNPPRGQSDIPWEHVLLAASALGTLLGLLCFGVFALMAGAVAVLYFVASGKGQPGGILAASLAVSLIGFIAGVAMSVSFWW